MVYVVDDEGQVRVALVHMLDGLGYAPWPFVNGTDFIEALPDLRPGCILLDVRMPGLSGTDVMNRVTDSGIDWPVVVMTAHADVPLAVQAMKLGAVEFIEKPFSVDVLGASVHRGFAKLASTQALRSTRDDAASRLRVLTPKERSVLSALMTGDQNKIVAHRLGLSVRTVEMHRANLLRKLQLRTLQEASSLIARAGTSEIHAVSA